MAILHAKSDKGNKSCAELRTYNYTRKGRYEVQMQAGSVPGTISSFFTYTGDAGTSSHYEVDIELMGAPTCSIPTSGSGASVSSRHRFRQVRHVNLEYGALRL